MNKGYQTKVNRRKRCGRQEKKHPTACSHCGNQIEKESYVLKRYKNHFCNKKCRLAFGAVGISQIEIKIQEQLERLYPKLEFHFNRRDTINSELDIFIPSLRLAFELNGPFHYEAVFSQESLERTKNNDSRKFQACIEKGISLCVIDIRNPKLYRKPDSFYPVLEIIINIIDEKRLPST